MILTVFGICIIFVFTTEGDAASLTNSVKMNEIGTLRTNSATHVGLLETNLGTTSDITTITLQFKNNIPNNTVLNISLKNTSGQQIGAGSTTLSIASKTVTINLSDTVTSIERKTLAIIDVT